MDALVMIGPQFIHAVPSEPQLEAVARKLFADGLPVARRRVVMRKELSALINLLLRLRLREERGGASCRFGDVAQAASGEGGDLTEAFVDALAGRDNGQAITLQQLSGAIELMVSI